MKYALYFSDLSVEQLARVLAAWDTLNPKYDPDGSKSIPEPRVYIVNDDSKPPAEIRSKTPDFEFPGPWVRFEMSKQQMQRQIAKEGDVVYFEPGIPREEADVEVVSNDTKNSETEACCVRALNSDGLKWILKRPEIAEKVSKIE